MTLSALCGAGLVVLSLAGCAGSGGRHAHFDPSKLKRVTSQLQSGDSINYSAFGTSTEVDCADGKSLNVDGSNNTLTIIGSCESVRVLGADNRLSCASITRSLTVAGLNNVVTYKNGEPEVNDNGAGNTVSRS